MEKIKQSEFDKFDAALDKIMSVSREEFKRREAEWKKQRAGWRTAKLCDAVRSGAGPIGPAGADACILACAISRSETFLPCRLAASPFGTTQTAKISGLRQPNLHYLHYLPKSLERDAGVSV
jgi:hypothetical protein